jgi:putative aminopeptidase FrvX
VRRIGQRLAGKAMDDRMLLAVLDLLLERLDTARLGYELWFGATVQEENGLHGAKALGSKHQFDYAIALDVGLVGDLPNVPEHEHEARLGGGPTLVHKDASVHYNKQLLWAVADAAVAAGVPFQHGVYANYGSDAVAFTDAGIPSLLIGVPCRYTHTAFEMIEPQDVLATVELLHAFVIKRPDDQR